MTRRYLDLVWSGASVPLPGVDAGYSVRCFENGDERTLTELQNACFAGSWGFCPNTVEETAAKLAFGTSFPCGIVFVEHGGRPVAYAWTFMSGVTGWIGMTGVHPDYRGRGLGKAALTAGMTYLAENGAKTVRLEVDDLNAAAKTGVLLGRLPRGGAVVVVRAVRADASEKAASVPEGRPGRLVDVTLTAQPSPVEGVGVLS